MYIDTYNTNNEDERFKKYVEILKSHDQLKKSLWNKINTPEVLKLEDNSDIIKETCPVVCLFLVISLIFLILKYICLRALGIHSKNLFATRAKWNV